MNRFLRKTIITNLVPRVIFLKNPDTHVFSKSFYLIWFVNCKTIKFNLFNKVSMMADSSDKQNIE